MRADSSFQLGQEHLCCGLLEVLPQTHRQLDVLCKSHALGSYATPWMVVISEGEILINAGRNGEVSPSNLRLF